MDETQNVTLSIPKQVLRKAKILAVQKETSLSAMLTNALVELVNDHEAYDQARERNIKTLMVGLNLGSMGVSPVRRDDLHER